MRALVSGGVCVRRSGLSVRLLNLLVPSVFVLASSSLLFVVSEFVGISSCSRFAFDPLYLHHVLTPGWGLFALLWGGPGAGLHHSWGLGGCLVQLISGSMD